MGVFFAEKGQVDGTPAAHEHTPTELMSLSTIHTYFLHPTCTVMYSFIQISLFYS